MKIKKLILSLCLLAVSTVMIAQVGIGWRPVYYKQNFRDSIYFNKLPKVNGINIATEAGVAGTYLPISNPTATGTMTTPIIRIGNAASPTIADIDSVSNVTGPTELTFYKNGDTLHVPILFSKRKNLSTALGMDLAIDSPASKSFARLVSGYTVSQETNRISDTVNLITFEKGSGVRGSQSSFLVNAGLGSLFNGGSDTLVITEARGVVVQDSGTVTTGVQVYYDANHFDATPTSVFSATANITSTTTGNSIVAGAGSPNLAVQKIPPSTWLWARVLTKSNGNMPTYLALTLSGYKTRGIITAVGGSTAPSFLTLDGGTTGWFDYTLNVTKDGSDYTSLWSDQLGSGHNLVNAFGQTYQPLWTADGILFDGVNDFMQTAAFTYNQPCFIYIVMKQITWTSTDKIFVGLTSITELTQGYVTSPYIVMGAPTESTYITNFTTNTWGIVRVLFNGASSKFILNAGTPVTGNYGANAMGGFTLGSNQYFENASNILVKEIILRNVNDASSSKESEIYTYLKDKYGL